MVISYLNTQIIYLCVLYSSWGVEIVDVNVNVNVQIYGLNIPMGSVNCAIQVEVFKSIGKMQ